MAGKKLVSLERTIKSELESARRNAKGQTKKGKVGLYYRKKQRV